MDEENLITFEEDQIEPLKEEDIKLVEFQAEADYGGTVETIDVVEVSATEDIIEMDSAFPPMGGSATSTNHGNLSGRYDPDQHPVEAIIGLKGRLENLEELKQVHSDQANVAQYYPWADGNPNAEDRSGYFVTFSKHNRIEVSQNNVFGVTVQNDKAGFIGNYTEDPSFGLVCVSGIVPVRTLSDVFPGDRVVPDVDGRAKRSTNDYGYRVVEIREELTERYAIIALVSETMALVNFKDDVKNLDTKLDDVQRNTVVAINAANKALSSQFNEQISKVEQQASSAVEIANGANASASEAKDVASSANTNAVLAKEIAKSAQTEADNIKEQVSSDIGDMAKDITELTEKVEPIITWDGTNGEVGKSYLIDHIQNNLATKTEVSTVDTRVDNAFTAIQSNAKGIQSIALVERKYSVGAHSPSYGLSFEEAKETLRVGMVYVPTENLIESIEGRNEPFKFYSGNSYEWDGSSWAETTDNVALLDSYIVGGNSIKYWYVANNDVTEGDFIYPANSLCEWINGQWVVVASSKDVSASWVASRIYQTASSLGAEIATANNNIISLDARIDDMESSITAMATNGDTIALMKAIANGKEVEINNSAIYNGAALVNLVQMAESPEGDAFYAVEPTWDKDKKCWTFADTYYSNPLSVCWAKVYENNTEITTKYYKYTVGKDNQWVRGTYEYANNFSGIKQQVDANSSKVNLVVSNIDGNDVINAASIVAAVNQAGSSVVIDADHIDISGKEINLDADGGNVTITSKNFKVTAGGSITATDGTIGGWTIGQNSLHNGNNDLYLGIGGISATIGDNTRNNLVFKAGNNFGVDSSGTLYATNAHVSGVVTASDVKINNHSIIGGNFLSLDNNGNLCVGKMTINGESGAITFAENVVWVLYATNKDAAIPEGEVPVGSSTTYGSWDDSWTGSTAVEVYARYSYDGGNSWTQPMRVQSKNGEQGAPGASGDSYSWIKYTKIENGSINTPTLNANTIAVSGHFAVGTVSGSTFYPTGYMGYGQGKTADATQGTTNTTGVVIATNYNTTDYSVDSDINYPYILVSNEGIRLQAGTHNICVAKTGAWYNGISLNGSAGTAVFG